jgi:glycolate oxidase iron-sulfur subunit
METHLADFIRDTTAGREAEEILRRCVHCGFCTATCPTYQLLGDELDGPRGRIYLIKQVLEGAEPTEKTRLHLDRCLTCRSCESTCPSGVHYTRLLDIGREVVEKKVPRSGMRCLMRGALKKPVAAPTLFGTAMKLGQSVRLRCPAPCAPRCRRCQLGRSGAFAPSCAQDDRPRRLRAAVDVSQHQRRHPRACWTSSASRWSRPAAPVLRRGAHAPQRAEGARDDARRNIDAWWPLLESGAEARGDDGLGLRHAGGRLRPPAAGRSRLRDQVGAGGAGDARHQRGHRRREPRR